MIWLLYRELHPHSGMKTYVHGLSEVSNGKINLVLIDEASSISPRPGDCVIFNHAVGDDGIEVIRNWSERGLTEVEYAILLYSALLQMDLSNELAEILSLLNDRGDGRPLDRALCVDWNLAKLLQETKKNLKPQWIPPCLPGLSSFLERQKPDLYRYRQKPRFWLPLTLEDRDSFYRHKNTYCQIAAVAMVNAQCKLKIPVFTNYASELLLQVADSFDVPLTVTGSISKDEYYSFLDDVTVGLCVSLAESFSYNCLELMLLGIPTLFSPTVTWAWRCAKLVEFCGVSNPGDTLQMAKKLRRFITEEVAYSEASSLCKRIALETIKKNHQRARETISGLIRTKHCR